MATKDIRTMVSNMELDRARWVEIHGTDEGFEDWFRAHAAIPSRSMLRRLVIQMGCGKQD